MNIFICELDQATLLFLEADKKKTNAPIITPTLVNKICFFVATPTDVTTAPTTATPTPTEITSVPSVTTTPATEGSYILKVLQEIEKQNCVV